MLNLQAITLFFIFHFTLYRQFTIKVHPHFHCNKLFVSMYPWPDLSLIEYDDSDKSA